VHAAVERGDGSAARGPGARTLRQLGEQGVEGLHGEKLSHGAQNYCDRPRGRQWIMQW
jgi:hypothetical protein